MTSVPLSAYFHVDNLHKNQELRQLHTVAVCDSAQIHPTKGKSPFQYNAVVSCNVSADPNITMLASDRNKNTLKSTMQPKTADRSSSRAMTSTLQATRTFPEMNMPTIIWSDNVETASIASASLQEDIVARISTLKTLVEQGFLSKEEYERRKNTIVDEITYTSRSVLTATQVPIATHPDIVASHHAFYPANESPAIVPHAPEFCNVVPEIATKHVFDYETRQWHSLEVYVCLDEIPFSKGSLRVVHHLLDLNEIHAQGKSYVAKLAMDPKEDPQTYFRDIETQAHCAYYARLYNDYNPPKRVEFIQAWILELVERKGALCAVEPFIEGEYRKHNNNFGCVSEDERNTPQAFSHFTYEASNHEILAVDIQGVGDLYTDPQIHTLNGTDFGKGNLGVLGFQKFLSSHRCNSICRYLKLPPVNPKDRHTDEGTVPLQELMNRDCVKTTRFESRHYYENAPMLQKYIAQCRQVESEQSRDITITWNSPSPPSSPRCAKLSCAQCCLQ